MPPTLPSLQLPSTQLPRTTCTQMLFLDIFIATAAPAYILNRTFGFGFTDSSNYSLDAFTACEPEVIAPWCRLFTINCKLLLSQQNIHSRPGIILRREESNHTGGRKHYLHLPPCTHHAMPCHAMQVHNSFFQPLANSLPTTVNFSPPDFPAAASPPQPAVINGSCRTRPDATQ